MDTHRRWTVWLRWLYVHNPFYVLSAGLMFYGLYVAFHAEGTAAARPEQLLLALSGYKVVMAITAFLVIKLGRVWEDARSMVLIVLVQFAAMSMGVDELCSTSPQSAHSLLLFGLGLSILVTEALLWGLSIKLPSLFRVPYHLLLVLFFTYPLIVAPRRLFHTDFPRSWRIYLFLVLVGLVFLLLIPAVRRGAAYVAKNGTPWAWPWFPLSAFGLLAVAAGVRSFVLTYNFHLVGAGIAFGTYYLAPLLLALLFLVAELAAGGRHRRVQAVLVSAAPLLAVLSTSQGGNEIYLRFLRTFTETVGSPLWLAILGLVGFYAYAWRKRFPGAEFGLMLTMALLAWVGHETTGWESRTAVQWWPWLVIGLLQVAQAIERRSSLRSALAAACLVAAPTVAWQDTPFLMLGGAVPWHLLWGSWLLIGLVFRDRFAAVLQRIGLGVAIAMAVVASSLDIEALSAPVRCGYPAALAVIAGGCWLATTDRWWLCAAAAHVAGLIVAGLRLSREALIPAVGSQAIGPLSWGAACFLVAVLISAWKAGFWCWLRTRLGPR